MSLRIKIKTESKVEVIQCENLGLTVMDLTHYEKLFRTIVKGTIIEDFSPKYVYMVNRYIFILNIIKVGRCQNCSAYKIVQRQNIAQ